MSLLEAFVNGFGNSLWVFRGCLLAQYERACGRCLKVPCDEGMGAGVKHGT